MHSSLAAWVVAAAWDVVILIVLKRVVVLLLALVEVVALMVAVLFMVVLLTAVAAMTLKAGTRVRRCVLAKAILPLRYS